MLIDHNPLVIPVLDILQQRQTPISEHELITLLRPQLGLLSGISSGDQLALFQTHFLLMNALYQLQADLLEEGRYLRISPLSISLEVVSSIGAGELRASSDQPLSEYYLDFANLRKTNEHDVERLLNGFWEHYLAHNHQADALARLGLPADVDWPQIQSCYRQLAAKLHPDRGGDAREFMQVREAFEVLRRIYAVRV